MKSLNKIKIIQSNLLLKAGFPNHGFTTRQGGVSASPFDSLNLGFNTSDSPDNIRENLSILEKQIKASVLTVKQVHESKIINAKELLTSSSKEPVYEADGIFLSENIKRAIAVTTADCVPLLVACKKSRKVLAIHAGWRPLSKGIVSRGIKTMMASGCLAKDILCAIGPAIGKEHYEVGSEVANFFPESIDPTDNKPFSPLKNAQNKMSDEKFYLDLSNAALVSLIFAGITSKNVEIIDKCTYSNPRDFFSYRRDNHVTGSNMAFICP